uniref:Uncharacterized protein n=1 Tax=Anguilla anguilla TaxID=7936 RepID=A0A0E9T8A3_ANGAN
MAKVTSILLAKCNSRLKVLSEKQLDLKLALTSHKSVSLTRFTLQVLNVCDTTP